MENLIKIAKSSFVLAAFALLVAANINVGIGDTNPKADNVKEASAIPLIQTNEALAGPCGDEGCSGHEGKCGKTVTLVKIGPFQLTRTCKGNKSKGGRKKKAHKDPSG